MGKLLYHHGNLLTMDPARPRAEAVLTENGIILGVGTAEELRPLAGEGAMQRDLEGRTMLPGFIDPHSHLTAAANQRLMVNAAPPPLGICGNRAALLETFRKGLETREREPGEWLIGMGYDPSGFPEGEEITRLELDQVSEEIPVLCIHASGHLVIGNTRALQLLGYWGQFQVPEGGTVGRFPDGTPNGLLTERAYLDPSVQAKIQSPSFEKVIASMEQTCKMYASYGITTIQDARVGKEELRLLRAGEERGLFFQDVVGQVTPELAESLLSGAPSDGGRVRMAGCKLFLDGSPQGKTAWLSRPYEIPPEGEGADYCGGPLYTDEEVTALAVRCLERGWQMNVHCNGDAACEQFLRCYARAMERTGIRRPLRPVMIHAQTVRPDQLERMKALGMMASFFLDHVYYWGDWHARSVLGAARAASISPARGALMRGVPFTLHQDTPVVPPNMLFTVQNAVCRKTLSGRVLGPAERLTAAQALQAVTATAAYQIFEEHRKGSIMPGKLADFVILGDDPTRVPAERIGQIPVLETIKEDKTIFKA